MLKEGGDMTGVFLVTCVFSTILYSGLHRREGLSKGGPPGPGSES